MNKIFIQTLAVSTVFFLVLFCISYVGSLAPADGGIKIEPIYVFIALVPFIILLIASGKLKEVKGPGGISLLMRDEAEKEIALEAEDSTLEVDPVIVQAKGGMQSLYSQIDQNPPTALSFVLGKEHYYGGGAIREYLSKLKNYAEFRHILFQSDEGKFCGYMKAKEFADIVETDNVVNEIENTTILQRENIRKANIRVNSSNREALTKMEEYNVNELAVVDSSEKFVGIIYQEQIVRKILSRLIREA